jgi:hypothetical protein
VIGTLAVSRQVSAGRRDFSWLYATDVLPAGGAELELWVSELDSLGVAHTNVEPLWLAPVYGITDQLEVALPIEASLVLLPTGDVFTLVDYGADFRWRLVSATKAPALVPLIRAVIKRDVADHSAWWFEADAVASYETGPVRAALDMGWVGIFNAGPTTEQQLQPAAGINVRITDDLRVGAEGIAAIAIHFPGRASWVAAGPSVAWTHGPFWLTLAVPIGISGVGAAPRLTWATAF